MCVLLTGLVCVLFVAASPAAAGEPVSVVPAKVAFEAGEVIEVLVTNIGGETVYLIPVFATYPYEYFYPPDNYLEILDGGYWRAVDLVRPSAFYDKRMLFFELDTGGEQVLSASLSDFGEGSAGSGGTFRAAVTVVVGPPSPVVSWRDFENHREGRQVTVKSGEFHVKGREEE